MFSVVLQPFRYVLQIYYLPLEIFLRIPRPMVNSYGLSYLGRYSFHFPFCSHSLDYRAGTEEDQNDTISIPRETSYFEDLRDNSTPNGIPPKTRDQSPSRVHVPQGQLNLDVVCSMHQYHSPYGIIRPSLANWHTSDVMALQSPSLCGLFLPRPPSPKPHRMPLYFDKFIKQETMSPQQRHPYTFWVLLAFYRCIKKSSGSSSSLGRRLRLFLM